MIRVDCAMKILKVIDLKLSEGKCFINLDIEIFISEHCSQEKNIYIVNTLRIYQVDNILSLSVTSSALRCSPRFFAPTFLQALDGLKAKTYVE